MQVCVTVRGSEGHIPCRLERAKRGKVGLDGGIGRIGMGGRSISGHPMNLYIDPRSQAVYPSKRSAEEIQTERPLDAQNRGDAAVIQGPDLRQTELSVPKDIGWASGLARTRNVNGCSHNDRLLARRT